MCNVVMSQGPDNSVLLPSPFTRFVIMDMLNFYMLYRCLFTRALPALLPSPLTIFPSVCNRCFSTYSTWCCNVAEPAFHSQPTFHPPSQVLQGTCNVVLQGVVGSLLPLFTNKLAADYRQWATDPAYRAQRSERSRPLQV